MTLPKEDMERIVRAQERGLLDTALRIAALETQNAELKRAAAEARARLAAEISENARLRWIIEGMGEGSE